MIIREIGAQLRSLFGRLTAKTSTITGLEAVYLDDSGSSAKAPLTDVIRYGGGSTTRVETVGAASVTRNSTGAIWLEVDGQTAGNARGSGAFDWQATRGAVARVASGANAVAIGSENTASASGSVAIGYGCNATGANAVALGSASGASGAYAVTIGRLGAASGEASATFGGYSTAATNANQVGLCGDPVLVGTQGAIQGLALGTTDATSTPLRTITTAATYRMVLPAKRLIAFTGIVTAFCEVTGSPNTYFAKTWEIKGAIKRDNSNSTVLVGTPVIVEMARDADGAKTPSTWAIASITADDTNEALAINVTGQASTTIRWQATLMYSQVGF